MMLDDSNTILEHHSVAMIVYEIPSDPTWTVQSSYHIPARRCRQGSRRYCHICVAVEYTCRCRNAFPCSDRIPSCSEWSSQAKAGLGVHTHKQRVAKTTPKRSDSSEGANIKSGGPRYHNFARHVPGEMKELVE